MHTTRFEDYVVITALVRFSHQFRNADPELSRIAWNLAVATAGEYGLTPSDVVRLLE